MHTTLVLTGASGAPLARTYKEARRPVVQKKTVAKAENGITA